MAGTYPQTMDAAATLMLDHLQFVGFHVEWSELENGTVAVQAADLRPTKRVHRFEVPGDTDYSQATGAVYRACGFEWGEFQQLLADLNQLDRVCCPPMSTALAEIQESLKASIEFLGYTVHVIDAQDLPGESKAQVMAIDRRDRHTIKYARCQCENDALFVALVELARSCGVDVP